MAVHGLVGHVREAQRSLAWLIAIYVVAFEVIGGLALTIPLGFIDPGHMILSNPLGYFLRYAVPVGIGAGMIFLWLYNRHADAVSRALDIQPVSRLDNSRFVRIAEEQCIAQGIRQPRFGVIAAPQLNALAVGEGPARGLIAVTTGLLDALDDEELAAVLAHEAAHIRHGDTKVLAANHALMRTAVLLQVNNALRFEDWRQLAVPLLLPPFLILMLLSGFLTMCAMKLAREARRGINLARDFAADAAAVRATHFPDALITALHKVNGRGGFAGSERYEDILLEGRSAGDGGSHLDVEERISALHRLTGSMIDVGRVRRDSRSVGGIAGVRGFGRRGIEAGSVPAVARPGGFGRRGMDNAAVLARVAVRAVPNAPAPKRLGPPPPMDNNELMRLMFTDFPKYKAYVAHCNEYYEWREDDRRNMLGLKREMVLPVAACAAFMVALYWPSDGDWGKFVYRFSPSAFADMGTSMSGTFCTRAGVATPC
jgi:Zn-dependent protease with chaperone function